MKILVCQHVPHELLGTLDPQLRKKGFRIRYANFGRFPHLEPSLDGYDGLILLGGPMNVGDDASYPHLTTEKRLVVDAFKRDIPVLGICLGSQIIADALGAPVIKNTAREIGWHPLATTEHSKTDPLLKHLVAGDHVFHWHGYKFGVPSSAVRLAASQMTENQAFRYGDKVYALQFHLEVDEHCVERWMKVPDNVAELHDTHGSDGPELLRAGTKKHLGRQRQLSELVFGEFITLFGHKKPKKHLPSR